MTKYIVKRIILAIFSILIVCAITFFAMEAIPGGPFNSEKAISKEVQEVLNKRYNLDKPVGEQFLIYMKNVLHGDFGVSLKTGRPIEKNNNEMLCCIGKDRRHSCNSRSDYRSYTRQSCSTLQKQVAGQSDHIFHDSFYCNAFFRICYFPSLGLLYTIKDFPGMEC